MPVSLLKLTMLLLLLCRLQVFLLVSTDAVVGSFPMVYQTIRELTQWNPTLATACTLAKVLLWQLGGWAYAQSFPEKYFPGVFDLVGASHQLMRFAVIGAHILDYLFVWEMFCRSVVVPASDGPLTAGAWLSPVANCTVGNHSNPFAAYDQHLCSEVGAQTFHSASQKFQQP